MSNAKTTKLNQVELVVREILHMSYTQFAEKVGVSRFTLGMWKYRGSFPKTPETLALLAEKTGLPLSVFQTRD